MNAPRALCALALSLSLFSLGQAAEPVTVEGRVAAVTVYQGQALVTREVEVADAAGLTEVVVTNLPDKVQPGSLYAEPTDGVEVRSVRYRVRPVEEDVREEVRELDAQIEDLQDQINANQRRQQLLQERSSYLEKLEQFTTGVANLEIKGGVLNADTLKSLTEFVFTQRNDIAESSLAAGVEQRELKEQLELLQRRRNVITQGSARTVREAVVFADLGEGGGKNLKVTYIVSNASWSPSYNLRASANRDRVVVEYNASIQQMSGEDWTDVEMTLSTATPSLVAEAPTLEPLTIKLAAPSQEQEELARNYAAAKSELAQRQRRLSDLRNQSQAAGIDLDALADYSVANGMAAEAAEQQAASGLRQPQPGMNEFYSRHEWSERLGGRALAREGGLGGGGFGAMFGATSTLAADAGLNRLSDEMQILECNSGVTSRDRQSTPPSNAEGISVTYQLAGATSLPSRADRQLIQIASLPLEGQFYRVATPLLTDYVYEEARLVNSTDQVLLAGPAATFIGGEFVGRGAVPTVSAGESFKVGLGIDSSLRVARELVERDTRIQGGNRVVELTYELSIENFGAEEAQVRLMDRLPKPENSDVKVTLVNTSEDVSDDEAYQADERKSGILRWDLPAPAGAVGLDRTKVRYTMHLEHDRQLRIAGLPSGQ